MNGLLGYVYLGISLSAPIGPINAAQMDKGLRKGFFHAWLFGLGAMLADFCYMLFVYFGLVRFMEVPLIQTFLWLFGAFVLAYTGIEGIFAAFKQTSMSRNKSETKTRSFISGFLMSISNPLTILFWLGIYGSVLAKTVSHLSPAQILINSIAIFSGILIWDFSMALLSSIFKRFLSQKLVLAISLISGLSLIGFSIYFGILGIQSLSRF